MLGCSAGGVPIGILRAAAPDPSGADVIPDAAGDGAYRGSAQAGMQRDLLSERRLMVDVESRAGMKLADDRARLEWMGPDVERRPVRTDPRRERDGDRRHGDASGFQRAWRSGYRSGRLVTDGGAERRVERARRRGGGRRPSGGCERDGERDRAGNADASLQPRW